MDNAQTLALIGGFLAPVAIAVINREKWSSQLKGVVAFLVCLVVAGFVSWYERTLNSHNLREMLPIVFASAIATYHWFWKSTGIAPTIEHSTG